MSVTQKNDEHTPTPPDKSTVILLLMTMGDTTWRMFVPIIGMTVLGLLVDKWLHTTPWIMVVTMIIGVFLAAILVKNQIKKVRK
jgi:hypothetical protein